MSSKKNEGTDDSLSELFDALSHEYRRRILVAVRRDNPQDEDDVASVSVATDAEDDGALELLKQQLYHTHLPKLDDAGFVEWDRDDGLLRRGPRFDEVEPLLELMSNHQDELPDDWP